jgi:uncharacterized protein YfaS (alpha-2-macroglobulin family)
MRLASRLIFLFALFSTPAFAAFDSAEFNANQEPLAVQRITPEGDDVPATRQIVIQFNQPVVPLGRMERDAAEIPITITPALNCKWHWLSTSALACELDKKDETTLATRFAIVIKPGIKTTDGKELTAPVTHTFITQRPALKYMSFTRWESPTKPVLRAVFNQSVTKKSVEEHVLFAAGTARTRVPVVASNDPDENDVPDWLPLPGEKALAVGVGGKRKSDDDYRRAGNEEARRIWLLRPKTEIAPDTEAVIGVIPGLVSAFGPERGIESEGKRSVYTLASPKFLGFNCTTIANERVEIKVGSIQKENQACDPQRAIQLLFNAPILRSEVRSGTTFSPPLDNGKPENSAWGDLSSEGSSLSYDRGEERIYNVTLPFEIKAATTYTVTFEGEQLNLFQKIWHGVLKLVGHNVPPHGKLVDEFGRHLEDPARIQIATSHRSPNYVLSYRNAVLEKDVDSEVPLYVNNIEHFTWKYTRLSVQGAKQNLSETLTPPKVQDIQFAIPANIRQMLGGKSGVLYADGFSDPVIRPVPDHLFAQVTPFQMHVKLGHFNSLAWVTDFATGKPVPGVTVTAYEGKYTALDLPKKPMASAITDENGLASLPGTLSLDPLLIYNGWRPEDPRLMLAAIKDGDMALLPLSGDFEINSYRAAGGSVYPDKKRKFGHMKAWGLTAQGVYRAGDLIQYKIYVRNQDNLAFTPAPGKNYWLEIMDATGKTVQTVEDITLSPFGGYSGEFQLAKNAPVGWYEFHLHANFNISDPRKKKTVKIDSAADEEEGEGNEAHASEFTWIPLRVLVSDFTPSPFKVTTDLNGDLFRAGDKVEAMTAAKLHSGGSYGNAANRVTAILTPDHFSPPTPVTSGFTFGAALNSTESKQVFQNTAPLDDKGEAKTDFSLNEKDIFYGHLMVESAVQDDRGKSVAASATAEFFGVDRFVGLKLGKWFYNASEDMPVEFLVVDERGKPVEGVKVDMTLERQERVTAKVKSAGNAYVNETEKKWVKEGTCSGTSAAQAASCALKAGKAGDYRLTATLQDSKGRAQTTENGLWVAGSDYVMWDEDGPNTYLDIIPDKSSYKVGDTAHYLVKNPYPGAHALITVERYGVMDKFSYVLKDSAPVIDIPVKPEYLPGFYVSVMVFSPRVEKPVAAVGQIDMGKPTFRMGYARSLVKDPYKQITVTATTDRDVYRPGEHVKLSLTATPLHPTQAPIELTVAVLDDSVFDLIQGGKTYYDPYEGFYDLDSLDLRNFSLLTNLVGRQKFEKKGANPGGDGGSSLSMRSVFKYISYWNPSLTTDANGKAAVEFDVPDNLTGWRVLAIATTPGDRFGLGDGTFKVNRPTEVRSEMPNQVTEKDSFTARFSVMNRTDKERTLKVHIAASGPIDTAKQSAEGDTTLTLKPYARGIASLPVKTRALKETAEDDDAKVFFTVTAGDEVDEDGLKASVPIHKMRVLDVAATYGTTTQDRVEENISVPGNIFTDTGSMSVVLSPSVTANLEGAFRYLKEYPYSCWEQLLTRGVTAMHYKNLRAYLPASLEWKEAEVLPAQILARAADYQAPNGGMTYFVATDEHADPYLSAYTALAFTWMKGSGYTVPKQVEEKLHAYLLAFLRKDTAPDYYSTGMASDVRAVILAALAPAKKITLSDIQRYASKLKEMSLFGKTHFALAAMQVENANAQTLDAAKMILASSNQSGGKFVFSETLDDSYARILASPMRENCAVLSLFTRLGETEYGKALVEDVPFKLVRTITQTRGGRDYWQNTQENMFCMNALTDYARIYEKETPAMQVSAAFGDKPLGTAELKSVRDPATTLSKPLDASDEGKDTVLSITREGTGRLYYAAQLSYASRDVTSGTNKGMEITREYSVKRGKNWELLKSPFTITRGEVVRVDLYLSLPAARNFVVVDDPVPGGLEPVNSDLATASKIDAAAGAFQAAGGSMWFRFDDWSEYNFSFWSFYNRELLHKAARFYADYLPAGNYHLAYTAQAIGTGTFTIMPVMAQEMYDPDVYGKGIFEALDVNEAQKP